MATKKTTNKSGSRSKSETAVAKTTKPVVMEQEDRDIFSGICQDLDNGDIGKFYHYRGCIGLVLVKERCPHGLYEQTIAEVMPHRSERTLRRYYKEGKQILADNNLTASDAYFQLKSFDPVNALSQGEDGRLLLGSGDDKKTDDPAEVPQAVEALANKINDKIEEKNNGGGNKKPPKKLTRAQKRDAAAQDLTLAVGKVNVALNGDWTLVDSETLETVSASLTVAAATIKEELKKRG